MAASLAAAHPVSAHSEPNQYLTFTVGNELLGIGILAVKEIIEYQGVTSVPLMPAAVRGVINLRGAVVPVVDLSARLGRGPAEVNRRSCIIIVELELDGEALVVGALVDTVNQVLELAPSEIEPTPSFGAKIRRDFIRGIGKIGGKFVVLLDVQHVLAVDLAEAIAELNCPV